MFFGDWINTKFNKLCPLNNQFRMVVAAAVLLAAVAVAQDFNKKFEYQYSFKGPYITQTDGSIPFWSHHGHALAGDDNIRLVPSLRSRQGSGMYDT